MKRWLELLCVLLMFTSIISYTEASYPDIQSQKSADLTESMSFDLKYSFGRGTASIGAWDNSGTVFAVGGSHGIWLYKVDEQGELQDVDALNPQPLLYEGKNTVLLEWHPNNTEIASVYYPSNNEIVIWDIQTKTQDAILYSHDSRINVIAWSPDGTYLVSGDVDGIMLVWNFDLNTQSWVSQEVTGHSGSITQLVWNSDSTMIASNSTDDTVRIWEQNTSNGNWEVTILSHPENINDIAWGPNGQQIATGGSDGILRIWDVESATEIVTYSSSNRIVSIAWNYGDTYIAVGYDNEQIAIWDVNLEQLGAELIGTGRRSINHLIWHHSMDQLISDPDDIVLWDVSSLTSPTSITLTGANRPITIALNPVNNYLIILRDNVIQLWDTLNGQLLDELLVHASAADIITWHQSLPQIATASSDGWLRTWDIISGDQIVGFPAEISVDSHAVSWSEDWTLLAATGVGGSGVNIYDWEQISIDYQTENGSSLIGSIPIVTSLTEFNGFLEAVGWNTSGDKFVGVTTASNHAPFVYDIDNGNWVFERELEYSAAEVVPTTLAMHPNMSRTAIGGRISNGGYIHIWDLATYSVIETVIIESTSSIDMISWSPDGNKIAGIGNQVIYIWDIPTHIVTTLDVEEVLFNFLDWGSSDLLAASSYDQIYIFDMSIVPSDPIAVLESDQARISSISWSLDGAMLASASVDGTIVIWENTSSSQTSDHDTPVPATLKH